MALLGEGVAAIWHDIAPEGEDDYHHWHCHEHVPERVSIPGFLRGRRYAGVSGTPRYQFVQDIFAFKRTGSNDNGKVLGQLIATGMRPQAADQLMAKMDHHMPAMPVFHT